MSHRSRRILFWSFFAIFIIATFFISLYAAGYRLNPSWPPNFKQILQQTGTLILDSSPSGATVTLSGEKEMGWLEKYFPRQKGSYYTPVKIKKLNPGEYVVRFESSGYWPYEKKIRLYPGEATYLEDVELFRQDLPAKIIDAKVQPVTITSDKKYLVLGDDKRIIDLASENETQITLTADTLKTPEDKINFIKPASIKYLSLISSDLLVYATDWEIYLFDAKENRHTLITRLSHKINSVAWRQGGYIIYSTANSINIINLKDRDNPTALINLEKMSAPVLDGSGNVLYFTAKIGNQEGLYKLFIK